MEKNTINEAELVVQYRQRLVAMLTRLTKDPDRAEDLAQDALAIVINKLREGGIREPSKLSAYMFSTARFLYFGWLRKINNQVELREQIEDVDPSSEEFVEAITREETAAVVRDSIDQLSTNRDRDILTRTYVREQSKKEVCDALLLSAEHYDRVISRARQRLRKTESIQNLRV